MNMDLDNFFIRRDYKIRENNDFLDTSSRSDEYQNDVYLFAKEIGDINNVKTIADVGCGSAFKLLKYFSDYETIGYDLNFTVDFLKRKYPDKIWIVSDFDSSPNEVDLVICADVIEHVINPTNLLNFIKKMNPKHIVMSTPDRDLLYEKLGRPYLGPPVNSHHIREWSYMEFKNYINHFFEILQHISIEKEYGQMIYCKLK